MMESDQVRIERPDEDLRHAKSAQALLIFLNNAEVAKTGAFGCLGRGFVAPRVRGKLIQPGMDVGAARKFAADPWRLSIECRLHRLDESLGGFSARTTIAVLRNVIAGFDNACHRQDERGAQIGIRRKVGIDDIEFVVASRNFSKFRKTLVSIRQIGGFIDHRLASGPAIPSHGVFWLPLSSGI